MLKLVMTVQTVGAKIIPILKTHGVIKAAIFGSYARGDTKKNSDIDLLVKYGRKKSLLDFVGLKLDLENTLKKKVDLLTYDSIYPAIKDNILKNQKIIYEKGL